MKYNRERGNIMDQDYITEGMLEVFLFESEQMLEQLEKITLSYKEEKRFDQTSINEIFRIMHTIKGSSGIMAYTNITALSHKLEDVFYLLRESYPENTPHGELVRHILDVSDFIKNELEKVRDGKVPDGDSDKLLQKIQEFLDNLKKLKVPEGEKKEEKEENLQEKKQEIKKENYTIEPVATEDSKFYKILIKYRKDTEMCNIRSYAAVYALKDVAEDILFYPEDIITNDGTAEFILQKGFTISLQTKTKAEEIMELIDTSTGVENIRILECTPTEFLLRDSAEDSSENLIDLDQHSITVIDLDEKGKGHEEKTSKDKVEERKITGETKAETKAKTPVSKTMQNFISVNVKKMDLLMDLIGEIVIAEAMVLQNQDLQVPGLELSNFQKAASQLTKITTELQDAIMTMRMMPLNNTFQKMNRIVYDLSNKLGKEVELQIIGENTEVDKSIIEHISDPLMHLMRNAVDHGIETNEVRKQAGKTEKAKIVLEAKNEGGKVWIIVEDNGAGLCRNKILKKAKANGLLGGRLEKDITDKEVNSFIMAPGFSTNDTVSEYSGRGVGLDVVVKNLQEVGGSLDIDTKEGYGTKMTLKIPLTLAIIDGIIIGVGDASYVVSTTAVKEFIQVSKEQLIIEPEGNEYIMIRGICYPVIRLNEFYSIKEGQSDVEKGIMAMLEHDGKQICVFVDRLIGEQEIVVKPIPSYIKKVRGISGCTQLGDGSISLILDTGGLMQE